METIQIIQIIAAPAIIAMIAIMIYRTRALIKKLDSKELKKKNRPR